MLDAFIEYCEDYSKYVVDQHNLVDIVHSKAFVYELSSPLPSTYTLLDLHSSAILQIQLVMQKHALRPSKLNKLT